MADEKSVPSLSANIWSAEVTAIGRQENPPPPPPETELDRMVRRMLHGVNACHEKQAYVSCATLIFTYIETLGGFLIGSERDWKDNKDRFEAFLERYFRTLMERIRASAESVNRDPAKYLDILYDKWRCGLVHEGIMKAGVALRQSQKFVFSPYVEITSEFELILNIDDLRTEFCTAIGLFKEDAQKDPQVRANFERRIKFLDRRSE